MKNRRIFAATELSDELMNDVLKLLESCQEAYDTEEVCFLEEEMNYDPDIPCYYLAYEEDRLVCFLSVFIPDELSAEIYSLTDPDYNDPDVFKVLINAAIETLEAMDIYDIMLVTDSNDRLNASYMAEYFIEIDSSTMLMELQIQNPNAFGDATDEPPSDYIYDHNIDTVENEEDGCSTHSMEFSKDGVYYGYAQCEQYPSAFCIHHVEVEESLRGKGHGKELLSDLLTYCIALAANNTDEETAIKFILNVDNENTAAYKLYKSFGFTCTQQIDYYII